MAFGKWISSHHPRDRRGRFSRKGGGGASKARASKGRSSKVGPSKTTRSNRKRVRTGALVGGTIGFLGTLGNPLAAVAGAGVGAAIVSRKNRKGKKAKR